MSQAAAVNDHTRSPFPVRGISLFHYHSLRSDFTGFIVAARRLRKVTTAIVTAKTAKSARANTQTCSGT